MITGESQTSAEILKHSIRTAQCLQHFGIISGDLIAICSENCLEYLYVIFGGFLIGATIVPLSNLYSNGNYYII